MRIALADLAEPESCVVEAAATYAAGLAFEDERLVWDRIDAQGRQRVMWLVAILRVSECLDRVCCASSGSARVTWSTDVLNLERRGSTFPIPWISWPVAWRHSKPSRPGE